MRNALRFVLCAAVAALAAGVGCQAPPRAEINPRFAELVGKEVSLAPVKNATLRDLSAVPSGGPLQQATIGTAKVNIPEEVAAVLRGTLERRGYRLADSAGVRLACEIERFHKSTAGGDGAVEIAISVLMTRTDGGAVTELYRARRSLSRRSVGAPSAYEITMAARDAAAAALDTLPLQGAPPPAGPAGSN